MNLTRKQKQRIRKNFSSKSPKKIADELHISKHEVEEYLSLLSAKKKKPKKIFYVIMILIPVLFFILLEIGLRTFNYGNDLSTWVKISDTYMGLNPDIAKRYFFTVKKVPQSIQDVFRIKKSNNTYRVFVLGGSSAAGYPFMPLGSFSRYIRRRLELSYPKLDIEVVNVSLTAVNTYTIRDLIPDVLEQSPDLILIYAGHNEYYGALGVGSLESLGKSRAIVNFLLKLNKYKTTQLLRDFIIWIKKEITHNTKKVTGTLMSRMAREQSIPYSSEIYNSGIEQFSANFSDILTDIKKTKVPVIVSTLACNLKDQPPFVSKETEKYPAAKNIFLKAENELGRNNITQADSLFRLAKELDQLRFRAPQKINETIVQLCKAHKIPVVNTDSILSSISPQNIIGNNLMVDHLHFTLNGYQLLGKAFYEVMNKKNYLPKISSNIPFAKQDSITRKNFIFSKLDSTISDFKIKLLKNDWPFVKQTQRKKISTIIHLTNFIDTLAFNFVKGDEEWEKVHRTLAVYFFSKGKFNKGKSVIDLLIHQYPTVVEYYNFIANELIIRKKYSEALSYLEKGYRLKPDHFFAKWIGIIYLSKGKLKKSIEYLERSLSYKNNDAQVLYNLSGAYAKNKNFEKALENIKKCLAINPNYKGAKILQQQLETLTK